MEIYKIPGKLVGNWNFEVHAMVIPGTTIMLQKMSLNNVY